jgi:hypothetical protein
MNDVSLFQGPPESRDVMPDTLNDMVWTLQDYQDYGEMNLPLYLVCRYKGRKTTTIKVPDTAKKCSAWFGNKKIILCFLRVVFLHCNCFRTALFPIWK